ncbi:hypothetical protein EI94DRAFT_298557 [Lactarius quietus]|nr:hypothetical protein EI94DRAFT_298557 [Lactarius quietus]
MISSSGPQLDTAGGGWSYAVRHMRVPGASGWGSNLWRSTTDDQNSVCLQASSFNFDPNKSTHGRDRRRRGGTTPPRRSRTPARQSAHSHIRVCDLEGDLTDGKVGFARSHLLIWRSADASLRGRSRPQAKKGTLAWITLLIDAVLSDTC